MATELRETAAAIEEVAAGTAKAARKAAARPIRTARKHVRVIERRGVRAARRINRQFSTQVRAMRPEVQIWGLDVNGMLPEKAAVKGLHLVKVQARRHGRRGEIAKRALHMLNVSFKTIARVATRFEQASELTPHPVAAVRPARSRASRRRTIRRAA